VVVVCDCGGGGPFVAADDYGTVYGGKALYWVGARRTIAPYLGVDTRGLSIDETGIGKRRKAREVDVAIVVRVEPRNIAWKHATAGRRDGQA